MQMRMRAIEKEAFELIDRIRELSPYEESFSVRFTDTAKYADEGSGIFYVEHDQVLVFLEMCGSIKCLREEAQEQRYWWFDEKSFEASCISGYMEVLFDRAFQLKRKLEGRVPILNEGVLTFLGKELDLSKAETQLKFVMCLLQNLNGIVPKKELVIASGLRDEGDYERAKKAKKLTETFNDSLTGLKKEIERKLKDADMEDALLIVAKSGSYGLFVNERAVERTLRSRR